MWPERGRALALTGAAAVVLFVALALLDGPLADTGNNTVAFELAGSASRAREIVDGWRAAGVLPNATFIDGLDCLFVPLYTSAIAGACAALAALWRRRGRASAATVGIVAAWAASAAAIFDWSENVCLAVVLLHDPVAPWPQIAAGAATIKFALTATGLAYAVVAGASALIARR